MGREKRRLRPTQRLHDLLFAEGFIDISISPNLGYWSHRHQDVCRWQGRAVRVSDMMKVWFTSWSTITECARRGIVIEPGTLTVATVEVYAKPPRQRCPKCKTTSGDDWSQCQGSCPMPMSPHYDPARYNSPDAIARVEAVREQAGRDRVGLSEALSACRASGWNVERAVVVALEAADGREKPG